MSQEQSQQPQEQQNDAGKTQKQFDEYLVKVASILGGKENLKPKRKVKGDIVTDIVTELTKERDEKTREEVKTQLGTLLSSYVTYEDEVKKKEDELKQLKEKKQKEFIEAVKKFFNKIEDVDSYANKMAEVLKSAIGNQ